MYTCSLRLWSICFRHPLQLFMVTWCFGGSIDRIHNIRNFGLWLFFYVAPFMLCRRSLRSSSSARRQFIPPSMATRLWLDSALDAVLFVATNRIIFILPFFLFSFFPPPPSPTPPTPSPCSCQHSPKTDTKTDYLNMLMIGIRWSWHPICQRRIQN